MDDCVATLMKRTADALADVGAYVFESFAGLAEAQFVFGRDVAEESLARRGRIG